MGIVVYWQEAPGMPAMEAFAPNQLAQALKFCEAKRQAGKNHVCISSELEQSVGRAGVNAVEARSLPDGSPYEWTKAHRVAGPERGTGA